jgi:hypothetical protein
MRLRDAAGTAGLLEELGSAHVQYSFRGLLVFRCGARLAVNEIRQTDFFFLETSCVFGGCGCRFRLAAPASGCV